MVGRGEDEDLALSRSPLWSPAAQVVMSQRLGGSLRRKVSETETQLLALHEAKLAAVSGESGAMSSAAAYLTPRPQSYTTSSH